jgi:hypothetical protein
MSKFRDAIRRVITGDNARGESVIIIDGGPSSQKGNPDLGEMFEIWEDAAFGPLTPKTNEDWGATRPVLGPRKGRTFYWRRARRPSLAARSSAFISSGHDPAHRAPCAQASQPHRRWSTGAARQIKSQLRSCGKCWILETGRNAYRRIPFGRAKLFEPSLRSALVYHHSL